MLSKTWNKLYIRSVYAFAKMRGQSRAAAKRRWLAVMERRTGKTCFYQPW